MALFFFAAGVDLAEEAPEEDDVADVEALLEGVRATDAADVEALLAEVLATGAADTEALLEGVLATGSVLTFIVSEMLRPGEGDISLTFSSEIEDTATLVFPPDAAPDMVFVSDVFESATDFGAEVEEEADEEDEEDDEEFEDEGEFAITGNEDSDLISVFSFPASLLALLASAAFLVFFGMKLDNFQIGSPRGDSDGEG